MKDSPLVKNKNSISNEAYISLHNTSKLFGVERFLLTHFWLPLLAFSTLLVLLTMLGGDVWLADYIYALEGNHWQLRSSFITQTLIHITGRNISSLMWFVVMATLIASYRFENLLTWRRPLAYLAISTLLSSVIVAWIKSWTNMDCPWDLIRYGGERPFIGLLELRPVGLSRGVCFPAGHASAGYAWIALYFFLLATRPRLRWLGLSTGIAVGLIFGFAQQLRGAHFMSHDVWTAFICWSTALGVYLAFQSYFETPTCKDVPCNAASDQKLRASTKVDVK